MHYPTGFFSRIRILNTALAAAIILLIGPPSSVRAQNVGDAVLTGIASIKITNTRGDWFYLEELEILNSADADVASADFGTTSEASEGPGFGSNVDGPIDDIFGNCCGSGWHSSTQTEEHTYTMTFPSPQNLKDVVRVWNRQDGCCPERLDGMLWQYFGAGGELIAQQEVIDLSLDGNINTEDGEVFEIAGPLTDPDGDGMPSSYETANGLDPEDATGANGAEGDLDQDGVTNINEFKNGTKPNAKDTDEDGVEDGAETGTGVWVSAEDRGTNPLEIDSDGDALEDGAETNTGIFVSIGNTGTDPNKTDSDGDEFPDNREIDLGSDPTNAASVPVFAIAVRDVRSIVITNTRIDWFYIEELDIRNDNNVDVASLDFDTVAMVSEDPGFGAQVDGPIDDRFANCCASGYHSSTADGEQRYTMTFATPQDIQQQITVWNRQDGCCAERLDGMLFEFFSAEGGGGELLYSEEVLDLAANSEAAISQSEGASFLLEVEAAGQLEVTEVIRDSATNEVTIHWTSGVGKTYSIERAVDLVTWIEIVDGLESDGETTSYTDDESLEGVEEMYYRVQEE
jgi:hypothetical protein